MTGQAVEAAGLRRFREPRPPVRAGERCDLCAEPLGEVHRHLVDVRSRVLRCACPACYPLFDTGSGRLRAVGDRVRRLPPAALAEVEAAWEAAGVPVGMAFAFLSTPTAGPTDPEPMSAPVAFYPSPAGATESLLPSQAWAPLFADPALAGPDGGGVQPDVEALLIRRDGEALAAYLVPIDACYELVGLVRSTWKGFDGGPEARAAIDAFFARLDARATGGAVTAGVGTGGHG